MKYLVANWKMNGSFDFISKYAENSSLKSNENVQYIIAPSSPYLKFTREKFDKSVKIASQDISAYQNGAYTSQISAEMARDNGCEFAIIGHSETRMHLNQSNNLMKLKVENAIKNGLNVIYCIGENLETRKAGVEQYTQFLENQIQCILGSDINSENFIIAYEPIWAIGTGITASTENISEVALNIQSFCEKNGLQNIKILYGGSVNLQNANTILQIPRISGLLIGGMSLKWEEFPKICF